MEKQTTDWPPQGILQGQVPAAVEAAFQQCFLSDVGIKDLSLLGASLDELVHQEVLQRAKSIFEKKNLPMFGHIDPKQMEEVLQQVPLKSSDTRAGGLADLYLALEDVYY